MKFGIVELCCILSPCCYLDQDVFTFRHGLPAFLWRTATPITVRWFACRTWENNMGAIPNRLTYCVIFIVCIQKSRVRSPALPDFLSSTGSGTGSTQPREPREVN